MKNPVETKVWAGLGGAGLGGAVATFLLWLLGVTVWGQSAAAAAAPVAVAAVPDPVSILLVSVISAAGSFAAGYLAPHSPRTGLLDPSVTAGIVSQAAGAHRGL